MFYFCNVMKELFDAFVDFASYSQKKRCGRPFEAPRDLNLNAPDFQSECADVFQKNE